MIATEARPDTAKVRPAVMPEPAAGRRSWWTLPVVALAAGLAVVELRGHLPSAASTWTALRQASPRWLIAAVVLQIVSMMAFAEQERRLLSAFGVAMPVRVSVAVTFARSAMATALPGGSAVAAAYGFRQFRVRGATRPIAAAVTLLCGVASAAGLAVVYAGDAVFQTGTPISAAIASAVAGVLVLAARRLRRTGPPAAEPPAASVPRRLRRTIHETLVYAAVVPARRWALVLALAALNWLADLLCLLACLHAAGLAVPVPVVGAAYLGAQLARQIPATAGGLGVIEAELILALTTSGAPAALAAAAVLSYRLLSCWILLPVGAACWSTLRRRTAEDASPAVHPRPGRPDAVRARPAIRNPCSRRGPTSEPRAWQAVRIAGSAPDMDSQHPDGGVDVADPQEPATTTARRAMDMAR